MPDLTAIFWAVATSYVVIDVVVTVLVAALVVGYFPLLKWFPVLGAYVPVGKLVSLLAMGLLCGLLATRMTIERYDAKQAAAKVAILQDRLDTLTKVAEADAARAAEDALYIAALEAQAGTTPPNDGPCLPADAAKRIGGIK
jgi:hypothetical protein